MCLTAGDSSAVFAYIPFSAVAPVEGTPPEVRLAMEVLGAGLPAGAISSEPGVGPASPGIPASPDAAVERSSPVRLGNDLHGWLREREKRELTPKIRAGGAPDPWAAAPAAGELPEPGDLRELNVALSCTDTDMRTGRVMWVSERAIILEDTARPTGLTAHDHEHFAVTFDTLVYPVATRHFGTPTDIDGNDRIMVFFTGSVNERNPRGSASMTTGLFWTGDLFPAVATARLDACPASNHAEIFYLAIPDPHGALGPPVGVNWIRDQAVRVMAHEYQHLLNAARRLYINDADRFEQTWLNEGLSHVAEELVFLQAAGLAPGSNIGSATLAGSARVYRAFGLYMSGNFENLGRYLARAPEESLTGKDGLATRGATWSFLRYAADRSGAGDEWVFFRLLNSRTAGLDNLNQVLAAPAQSWIHDWAVALYADDHVDGVDPVYTQPSWNFRDLYARAWGSYPLSPTVLRPGSSGSVSLQPGGAGFLVFGVEGRGAAALHVEADAATPPRSLQGSFLRIR